MTMWLAIFVGMFAVMLGGIVYLISRVYRTEAVASLAKGNKHIQRAVASAVVLLACVLCYLGLGMINAAIVIVHALCIWILIDLIVWGMRKLDRKSKRIRHADRARKTICYNTVMLVGVGVLVAYFGFGWYEAHHVARTQYDVQTEKNVGALKVVQITDSHMGTTFDGDGFARELEKIQQENPDLVVVTGDFVDDDTSKEDMIRASEALGTLKTKYGVYFVFGNHDKGFNNAVRGFDAEDLVRELEANGVKVLQDETVTIADQYYLIGRQDRSEESSGGRASMDELVSGLDKEKFMIVLDHQPNDFDAQEKSEVDLVLSGHTHGGQFFPINKLGEWAGLNDMTYGIRQRGGTVFEVSSGISDWAIKFKTGCKSEYVVLEIHS